MDCIVIVRKMTAADLDAAIKLWNISFKDGYSSEFDTRIRLEKYLHRNPGISSVACLENGQIVGALMCGHDGRRGSIYHTAVYEEYRRKGIGKKMEERSINELKKAEIDTGFLFISILNPGSKEFWESIGWHIAPNIRYLYKSF